jgi:hypothetical protein
MWGSDLMDYFDSVFIEKIAVNKPLLCSISIKIAQITESIDP